MPACNDAPSKMKFIFYFSSIIIIYDGKINIE